MIKVVKTFLASFPRLLRHQNYLKKVLPQLWYVTNTGQQTSEIELKTLLQAKFPDAKTIQVEDTSGGCGAMYNVYVETKDFKGISITNQHKAVYGALHEKIKLIHGLHVVTKAPQ